jgi:mannose-6-phosphate isomerase class I
LCQSLQTLRAQVFEELNEPNARYAELWIGVTSAKPFSTHISAKRTQLRVLFELVEEPIFGQDERLALTE